MPGTRKSLIWSEASRIDLIRLREFIEPHNPDAAKRAAEKIKEAARLLIEHPLIGTRVEERQYRDIPIPFGRRGYTMRYRVEAFRLSPRAVIGFPACTAIQT